MTTQPSDWAVARAWAEVLPDGHDSATYRVVVENRAREIEAADLKGPHGGLYNACQRLSDTAEKLIHLRDYGNPQFHLVMMDLVEARHRAEEVMAHLDSEIINADAIRRAGAPVARELDASGGVLPLEDIIGSMRNFADVADDCPMTENNAPAAIRAWADMLESTPRAAEAGDTIKAVLDWQPLTHLNKGDRLYQILEAAGLPFDDQAESLRAAMGAVGAGGGESPEPKSPEEWLAYSRSLDVRDAEREKARQAGGEEIRNLAKRICTGSVAIGSDGEWVSVRRHLIDELRRAYA